MAKGGRKPSYDYEDAMFLLEMEGLARDEYDNKHIAEYLGLSESQFSRNVNKFPQLAQALKRGRRPLCVMMENSLFKRGVGMKVTTIIKKYIELPDGTTSEKAIIQETITELPPDTGAAMAYLKHNKPDKWNKQPTKVAATDPTGEKAQAPLLFLSAEAFTEEQIQGFIKQNIAGGAEDEAGDND